MDNDEDIPALYRHASTVWGLVKEGANEDGLWEGRMTELVLGQAQVSVPYYGKVLKTLVRKGCLEQIRRGGGQSLSQWKVLRQPTFETYKVVIGFNPKGFKDDPTKLTARVNIIEERLQDISKSIGGVDIRRALVDLQTQINGLKGVEDDNAREDVGSTQAP